MDHNMSDDDFVQVPTPKQRRADNSAKQKSAKSVKKEEEHDEVMLEQVKEEEDHAGFGKYENSDNEETFKPEEDSGDSESEDEEWEEVDVSGEKHVGGQ